MPSERVQRRIDALLDDADESLSGQDWQRAAEISHAVLALDRENADAVAFLAAAEKALKFRGEAIPDQPPQVDDSAEASDVPTSFADGRYKVIRLLGEGGKKLVYLVHDTTLDRDVAFGLIKAEGLDDPSRQRISREAQMMGRLGTHPNIVTVFDLGTEGDEPYMVTELMGGGDVEALLTVSPDSFSPASEVLPTTELASDAMPSGGEHSGAASDRPFNPRLSLERAIEIARAVCEGLVFAHSVGIVHRDLKPGNVWLTDDGTAKIGDFGLAMNTDQSRLTREGMIVGTVHYMSPEQAIGGEITPKTDLYSLGAMLYEMVTGRPPFMGDDSVGIIGQHVNTPPVAPSWHNQSLPKTLDSLIMRLLAKDPAERPESAQALLQALDSIDPAEPAEGHEGEQGSLDSMSEGVFVGRQREMDQLKANFEDALSGHGKMVTLVGEPGIGKTRTAQELATYAAMRGGQVLWGRCYEGGGAPPYWPWIQAIRSYVLDRDAEVVRREMGSTASVIGEIVPDVKERLPELHPPSQIDDPDSARFRLFDSITTFMKTASGAQPIVLVLEDLHWSDKPSLALLEFIARELTNSRLMIVANYRDMELNRRHPLSITLGELTREHLFDRVLLRGLQRRDVKRFIEVAAGIDPPSALVDAVHTQAEGNPLFLTETVRLLIQEGDIASGTRTEGGTSSWAIRIPEGAKEVIGRRLDRLSERCNEMLTVGAVIGRQFSMEILGELTEDLNEDRLLDLLDEALGAKVLEELPNEIGRYQFTHALIQQTLSDELPITRRVRLHARIAEALEAHYGENSEAFAAELAEHFAEAETVLGTARLVRYSALAGQAALDSLGYDEALIHFRRAYEAREEDAPDEELADILTGLARAEISASSDVELLSQGVGRANDAFDYYAANGQIDKAIAVAVIPFWIGTGDPVAVDLTRKAIDLAIDDTAEASFLLSRYSLLIASSDAEAAWKYSEQSVKFARASQDARAESWALYRRSLLGGYQRRETSVLAELLQAIDLARSAGDRLVESLSRQLASFHYLTIGKTADSISHADAAYSLALTLADRGRLAQSIPWRLLPRILAGRWGEIEEILSGHDTDSKVGTLTRFHIASELGDRAALEELADQSSEALGQETVGTIVARVNQELLMFAQVLRRSNMESQLQRASDAADIESPISFERINGIAVKSMYSLYISDAHELSEAYETLRAEESHATYTVVIQTLLAEIASKIGNTEAAEGHFELAIAHCQEAGWPPEIAWAQFLYSDMLLGRNAMGDREKATELQDEAIAIAQELGMKPLLERVLAQREILKA